jgi:hypothetical protein
VTTDVVDLGDYAARDMYQDTFDRRRGVLGNHHPHTLASASALVRDLRALGEDDAAEELQRWIDSQRS